MFERIGLWRIVLLGVIIMPGCATLEGQSEYDSKARFDNYRQFAWLDGGPLIQSEGRRISPLNASRVEEAIEQDLTARHFVRRDSTVGVDFIVSFTVGLRDKIEIASYPVDYRDGWHWSWPYSAQAEATTYSEGTLAIDIFDGRTRKPVWHGWVPGRVTHDDADKAARRIKEAVSLILENFPPLLSSTP